MNAVLILILVLAVVAAVFITRRRQPGKAASSAGGGVKQDFVEAANAATRAARQNVAAGLASPLGRLSPGPQAGGRG
jgi:preprotein translocase subunit SecG